MSKYTLGLCEIKVGDIATGTGGTPTGDMPTSLAKLGKTYKDTAKISQNASDVTEHYEEGKAAPEIRKKAKKIPVLEFSIMDADADLLAEYIGGTAEAASGATEKTWSFDGDEIVANKAIKVVTEQGFDIDIPNADIEATIDADLSAKGIFLVKFVVTPCATGVSGKKAFRCVPKTA